jgi:hypothetical protein
MRRTRSARGTVTATASTRRTCARPSSGPTVTLGRKDNQGIRTKSLLGLPWRYALRVVDELGLILRRDQIWSKPNGLPESVTDRTRSSHEYLFHFVKRPDYYSAVDEIREPHDPDSQAHVARYTGREYGKTNDARGDLGASNFVGNPLGKLPGSVWTIPTQPLRVPWGYGVEAGRIARYFTDERDALAWLRLSHRTRRRRIRALPDHFAAFPLELPRRIIRGWSPPGICTACGEGRRAVVEAQRHRNGVPVTGNLYGVGKFATATGRQHVERTERSMVAYACACLTPSAPTRPAVVLDPFGGTCTTALAARAESRIGWAVDLSADYCRLGRWRVTDPGERARALEVRKPPPAPTGIDALFDLEGA